MHSKTQVIKTYSRIKPLFNQTQQKVFFRQNVCTLKSKNNQTFSFDGVFDQAFNNQQIYKITTHNVIQQCFQGFNACMLAYGQTFSGKTHTMKGVQNDPGIIPQCLNHIFKKIKNQNLQAKVKIMYLEIYNQDVIDLLHPSQNKTIQLRQDGKKNLLYGDAKQIQIVDVDKGMECFQFGQSKRKFASNKINNMSSRSHTIFKISLIIAPVHEEGSKITSQINLVDLAGSQSIQKTKGEKSLKSQGQNINKSLLALQRVIRSMSAKQSYTNFRDSKLTRILQRSFCQNSNSSIICMINPTATNYAQSINTLKFGMTAAKIKIQMRQNLIKAEQITLQKQQQILLEKYNDIPTRAQLQQLKNRINQLQGQNNQILKEKQRLQNENYIKQNKIYDLQKYNTALVNQLNQMQENYKQEKLQLTNSKNDLQRRVYYYKQQTEKLDRKIEQLQLKIKDLQKNQRFLLQAKQEVQIQLRGANYKIQQMKQQLNDQLSRSKQISFQKRGQESQIKDFKQKNFFPLSMPNAFVQNKPNPFKLAPYVPPQQRKFQSLSPMKLNRIVQLKTQVVEMGIKMKKIRLEYIQLQQKYQQLKKTLQKKQKQEEQPLSKRSSGKINPVAFEYEQIRRLKKKISSLQQQLKRSELRAKKNRQKSKQINQNSLQQIQQFDQFLRKKHDDKFNVEVQVQVQFSSKKQSQKDVQIDEIKQNLFESPLKPISKMKQSPFRREQIFVNNNQNSQNKNNEFFNFSKKQKIPQILGQNNNLNDEYKILNSFEKTSLRKLVLSHNPTNQINNPQKSSRQKNTINQNCINDQKISLFKNNQNRDLNIMNNRNNQNHYNQNNNPNQNNNFNYNSPTKSQNNKFREISNGDCRQNHQFEYEMGEQNHISIKQNGLQEERDSREYQNLLSSVKKTPQNIPQNNYSISNQPLRQYEI